MTGKRWSRLFRHHWGWRTGLAEAEGLPDVLRTDAELPPHLHRLLLADQAFAVRLQLLGKGQDITERAALDCACSLFVRGQPAELHYHASLDPEIKDSTSSNGGGAPLSCENVTSALWLR